MNPISPDRFEDGPAMLMAGLRRKHVFASIGNGIAEQWKEFNATQDLPGRTGNATYGIICGSSADGFEYMCATEVSSFDAVPPELGRVRIPAQHYAIFTHHGHASLIGETWSSVLAWLARSDWQSAENPDFERYGAEYDRAKECGGTEIRIGVIPKSRG